MKTEKTPSASVKCCHTELDCTRKKFQSSNTKVDLSISTPPSFLDCLENVWIVLLIEEVLECMVVWVSVFYLCICCHVSSSTCCESYRRGLVGKPVIRFPVFFYT